jgi:hypothetical protein
MIGTVLTDLGPVPRVFIAVGPFVAAILVRLLMGRNRLTGSLLTFATGWFAMNVLLAPSAEPMRQDLYMLPSKIFH